MRTFTNLSAEPLQIKLFGVRETADKLTFTKVLAGEDIPDSRVITIAGYHKVDWYDDSTSIAYDKNRAQDLRIDTVR